MALRLALTVLALAQVDLVFISMSLVSVGTHINGDQNKRFKLSHVFVHHCSLHAHVFVTFLTFAICCARLSRHNSPVAVRRPPV